MSDYCPHGHFHGLGCLDCKAEAAFWWGFTHPFSKPYPWWSNKRRQAWCERHGKPWEAR